MRSRGDRGAMRLNESAITQHHIEQQIRKRGDEIENEDTAHTREISKRNERDLRGERKRDVEPRAANPGFRRVERPERVDERARDGAADHEDELAIKMRIFAPKDEEKGGGEKPRAR